MQLCLKSLENGLPEELHRAIKPESQDSKYAIFAKVLEISEVKIKVVGKGYSSLLVQPSNIKERKSSKSRCGWIK